MHLIGGGGLLRSLVRPVPEQPREADADPAVGLLGDLADRRLVHGRLGKIRALHLPHLVRVCIVSGVALRPRGG